MPTRRTSASAPAPAASLTAGLVRRRLESGACVLCLPTGAADAPVAVQLWIAAGTAAERPSEHGCAHLLEHMLFKPLPADGSAGITGDLARAVETVGGDVNAFTSHDETVLYATVPAPAWGGAVDAILGAALRPTLDAAETLREREVVVEEIKQYDDEPGQRSVQALLGHLHAGHAYARPVLGLAAEVRSHSARRLRAFHRRTYAGERLTLVVVGPVDPAAVFARARRILLAAGEGAPLPARRRPRPAEPGGITAIVERGDVQEAHLFLGWRGPGLGDPDIAALDVAAVVLGHGEASRLVREVRRRLHRVSDVHASLDIAREAGTFLITARSEAAQVAPAVEAILLQAARLGSQPIAGEELARARAVLESDLSYRRETVQGLAHVLGYYQSLLGDPEREAAYFEALARLRAEDVQRAAAAWLDPSRLVVSVLVPEAAVDAAGARALRRELTAGGRRLGRSRPKLQEKGGIARATLGCGLRVLVRPDASLPITAAWLTWLGGLRREPAALAGLTTATSALLTRGNARCDGDALSREIEGMAASLDGFAGRSSVGLHGESLARSFPAVLEHLIECALTPTFPADELDEERRVALQEIAAADDDLGTQATRAFRALLYGDHPYHRSLRGTRAGVRALTPEILRREWRRMYPIGDAVLAIVGDVDPAAAVAALEARLAEIGGRSRRAPARLPGGPPTWPSRAQQKLLRRAREQAHVVIGFPGLTLTDPRMETLEVLATILGGQSGRLFQALREEDGLVYQVDASSTEGLDAGHVSVYASTSQDKLPRALAAIERHLERIVAEAPAEDELERAKAWLIGQHGIGLQRRARVASHMALGEALGEGAARYLGYPGRVERVRGRDVLEVARAIVRGERRVRVVVAGPGVRVR